MSDEEYEDYLCVTTEPTTSKCKTSDPDVFKKTMSREEVAIELRELIQIDGCHELKNFMETKVVTKKAPNPFVTSPVSETDMKNLIDSVIKYHLKLAYAKVTNRNQVFSAEEIQGVIQLKKINEEIIQAAAAIGNLSKDILNYARNRCRQFIVHSKNLCSTDGFIILESFQIGNFGCEIPSCCRKRCVHRVMLEPLMYNRKMELQDLKGSQIVLNFCSAHLLLFELAFTFIHLIWDIYMNCETAISNFNREEYGSFDELCSSFCPRFFEQLQTRYLARYHLVWAFGNAKLWKQRGFTLYQILSL